MTGCLTCQGVLKKLHGTENLVDTNQIPFLYVQGEVCLALW